MSNLNFNAAEVEPQAEFTPLPAGEYLVMATDSEVKQTKNGQGHYLQLTLQVIDGHYKNRLVFDRINIQNANPTAQEIGQRALSALCHAVGKLQISDSVELHHIPFIVRLSVRQDPQYGDSNEVKAYKSANGSAPAVSTRPAASAAPAAKPYNAGSYAEKSGPAQTAPIPAANNAAAKPAWAR